MFLQYVRKTTIGIYSQRKILEFSVWFYIITVFCWEQLFRIIKLKNLIKIQFYLYIWNTMSLQLTHHYNTVTSYAHLTFLLNIFAIIQIHCHKYFSAAIIYLISTNNMICARFYFNTNNYVSVEMHNFFWSFMAILSSLMIRTKSSSSII